MSLAYDPSEDSVWVYPDFGATIRRYSPTGAFLSSVNRPGEAANDADLDIASEAFTLNATPIPAGTLLFFNGESGATDVYAVDKTSGVVLATLTTSFGVSHVVGGAYHRGRNSLFLVQDRVPAGSANDNIVAEINPVTGAVINTFDVDTALPGFTVNYGDIEVSTTTGNLLVVSSDESAIAEFSPTGTFVRTLALPTGVSALSGIALDDARGRAWVASSDGVVWQLGAVNLLPGDADGDGDVDGSDFVIWSDHVGQPSSAPFFNVGDFDGDGDVDGSDFVIWSNHVGQSQAPGGIAALAAVPEPGVVSLVGVGLAGLMGVRRRR